MSMETPDDGSTRTAPDKVKHFFEHVVRKYIRGDIEKLLSLELDEAGPLLATVMGGIDTLGGMMLAFRCDNSCKRSVHFMQTHLKLSETDAMVLYKLVRCGVAHEGVAKLGIRYFVHYGRCQKGVFLYKSADDFICLNVAELAWSYLDSVKAIAENIPAHLKYVPEVPTEDEALFAGAIKNIPFLIDDFCATLVKRGEVMPLSSSSPIFAESLEGFTLEQNV